MTTADDTRRRLEIEREALDGCEAEPIQFIGSVQPYGWLMTLDLADDLTVRHVSSNLETLTGIAVDDAIGRFVDQLLPRDIVHTIRNILGHSTIETTRENVDVVTFDSADTPFALSIHRTGGLAILEGIPANDPPGLIRRFNDAQRVFARLALDGPLEQMLTAAVHEVRVLLGYERVKVYRFAPDGSGDVIAESRVDDIESYLGLRFPSYDIPAAARQLYTTTPIRIISDTTAGGDVAIVGGGAEVDLSLSILRGTADVHTQYLRNMRLGSSLSLPVVVDGRMWGLFACHDRSPRVPTPGEITLAELLSWSLSTAVATALRGEADERRATIAAALDALLDQPAGRQTGMTLDLTSIVDQLLGLTSSDGLAVVTDTGIATHGHTPSRDVVATCIAAMRNPMIPAQGSARFTTELATLVDDDLGTSRGALLLDLPITGLESLVFFRDEAATSIDWAGAPSKEISEADDGFRLNPRASFAAYRQEVEGQSNPWESPAVRAALDLVDGFGRLTGHIELNERVDLLVRELSHRIRNTLSLVSSIAHYTGDAANDVDEFIALMDARLDALSAAHGLLTDADWEPVDLGTLLRRIARPFDRDSSEAIRLTGPSLLIAPGKATTLTLLFHEMFANAARHGSLSSPTGTVDVEWNADTDGAGTVTWRERGGPTVAPPSSAGFGTSIIRDGAAHELGGIELDFAPEGLTAVLSLDARRSGVEGAHESVATATSSVRLGEALVVEDDFMVAMNTKRMLEELGADNVTIHATASGARHILDERAVDFAVLDVSLEEGSSLEIAALLRSRAIPFVFATGYGSSDANLQNLGALAVLTKPVSPSMLAGVIDAGSRPR
ncbi:MAG: HWE histidine kinase domain-containing protein [Actinomycetota bacterium]